MPKTTSFNHGDKGPSNFPFLSQAVRAGDFVFVSGSAGLLPGIGPSGQGYRWMPGEVIEGGIVAETKQTLETINNILLQAGGSLKNVVKLNTFLRDVDRNFHDYNRVYAEYFPENPPARTTVQAKIYGPLLIEIECTAYIPLTT